VAGYFLVLRGDTRPRPCPDPDIQTRKAIRRSFLSQFQAAATGKLFLYLNDAITAVPFGPLVTCFYGNSGGAKVTVELMPSPQPPPPEPYDFSQNR